MGIKVKCKNCNKEADSDSFKLHYKYKLVVCPDCFSGRNEERQKKEAEKVKVIKPKGWDVEDEYLEKYNKFKEKEKAKFSKDASTNQMRCTCGDCKFTFNYDPFRKRPSSCPYCNADVPRMDTFKML